MRLIGQIFRPLTSRPACSASWYVHEGCCVRADVCAVSGSNSLEVNCAHIVEVVGVGGDRYIVQRCIRIALSRKEYTQLDKTGTPCFPTS